MASIHPNVEVTLEQITAFCEKWQIVQFELFGSVLRDDFRPDSDIEVLVTFAPGKGGTLYDLLHMEEELKALFGRDVDLVQRPVIEKSPNYIRRKNILTSTQRVYAARSRAAVRHAHRRRGDSLPDPGRIKSYV